MTEVKTPDVTTLAITHADRYYDVPNPGHTPEGFGQLEEIQSFLLNTLEHGNFLTASGSGQRFLEIHEKVCFEFQGDPKFRIITSFLGCSDANLDGGDRMLPSGISVPKSSYLKIADGARAGFFNPWSLIARLEKLAKKAGCELLVIATGAEFMNALQIVDFKSEQGSIYSIDFDVQNIYKLF